ncbi:MAG: glycine betaine ABC transporter substrate-binding protein [Cyanobacteria bacterium P01_A01_bin.45]
MKKFFAFFVVSLCLVLAMASCTIGGSNTDSGSGGDITIGAKAFTEQDILGELLAQHIEATTNLKVNLIPRLGGTIICHTALIQGKIDAYIEYTGTSYNAILKEDVINDPQEVYNKVKTVYDERFNLEVMEPLGFENTYAMLIRKEDAKKYNIRTLSEASKQAPKWRAGVGYEFMERKDGYPGLAKTYDLNFKKSPRQMEKGLLFRAIKQNMVDMIAGYSTDGQIARLDLVILEDDKKYFPPYEAMPVFRKETLKKYPQLRESLAKLNGLIDAKEMQELNYQIDGELRKVKTVVEEFRKKKGLA